MRSLPAPVLHAADLCRQANSRATSCRDVAWRLCPERPDLADSAACSRSVTFIRLCCAGASAPAPTSTQVAADVAPSKAPAASDAGAGSAAAALAQGPAKTGALPPSMMDALRKRALVSMQHQPPPPAAQVLASLLHFAPAGPAPNAACPGLGECMSSIHCSNCISAAARLPLLWQLAGDDARLLRSLPWTSQPANQVSGAPCMLICSLRLQLSPSNLVTTLQEEVTAAPARQQAASQAPDLKRAAEAAEDQPPGKRARSAAAEEVPAVQVRCHASTAGLVPNLLHPAHWPGCWRLSAGVANVGGLEQHKKLAWCRLLQSRILCLGCLRLRQAWSGQSRMSWTTWRLGRWTQTASASLATTSQVQPVLPTCNQLQSSHVVNCMHGSRLSMA